MSLHEAFREASRDGRVCPMPRAWQELWQLLPEKRRRGNGWEPPLPLILAAWHETSNDQKRQRLHEHLRWAHEHGALDEILAWMRDTAPEQWLTEE